MVYAHTIAYDISSLEDDDTDTIGICQANIDEWARQGVLTGDNLQIARDAMSDKIKVTSESASLVSDTVGYVCPNVNGESFDMFFKEESPPSGALWNDVGNGVKIAVVNERIYVLIDVDGKQWCGAETANYGGELTNAMVNKYRGKGTPLSN